MDSPITRERSEARQNASVERLTAKVPPYPLGLITSPLQRFVRPCLFSNCNQPESDATTITRECSGMLTPESNNLMTPFSIIPTTATGLRGRRCASTGRGTSPGADSGIGSGGAAASCSSNDFRLPLRSSGYGVGMGISLVCGDDKDWRIVDLPENVRDLVRIAIVSPDHPHAATRRHLCQHTEGSILPLLKANRPIIRCLDLLGRQGVIGDLLEVPLDPFKPPHF